MLRFVMDVLLSIGLDTQQTFSVKRPKFSSEKFSCIIFLTVSSYLFLWPHTLELLLLGLSQI